MRVRPTQHQDGTLCTQIMDGVHENMLSLPYMDHGLDRTVAMCEWLQHFDVWQRRCHSMQQFELLPLLPAATLAVANLCRSQSRARLKWPKAGAAAHKKLAFNRAMIADWLASLPGDAAGFSVAEAACHRIPALVATLSPRPEALDGVLLGSSGVQQLSWLLAMSKPPQGCV